MLIGTASLSFADRVTSAYVVHDHVRDAVAADAESVLSRCSDDERNESGLAEMRMRLVASDRAGEPVALAGYEVWDAALAHLGLAVARGCRSRGFGQVAAAAAARSALGADLVPQWRCRLDDRASARVRDHLGFVQLGGQVAIDLAATLPRVVSATG